MVTMLMMVVVAQDETIPGVGRGSVVVGLNQSNVYYEMSPEAPKWN